ncbi:MAG: hypothetical protein ACK4NF_03540 [Planctomycetota bacterium]
MVVIIVVLLIASLVGGGMYYYYNTDQLVEPSVVQKVDDVEEYLLKTLVNSEDVYKVVGRYFKEIIVYDKGMQITKNSITQILLVKFKTSVDSNSSRPAIPSFLIKNTISIYPQLTPYLEGIVKAGNRQEHITSRRVKFHIKGNQSNGRGIIPKVAKGTKGFNFSNNLNNYLLQTTSINISDNPNPFNSVEAIGYLNKERIIHLTLSIMLQEAEKDNSYFSEILSKLSKIKSDILNIQVEKVAKEIPFKS